EGTTFGNVPLNLELKLEVWDSPNSAGVVIDSVRCAKLALDHGLKGALIAPSAYFKKSPPVQYPDDQAREMVEDFIRQYGQRRRGAANASRNGANGARGAGSTRGGGGARGGRPTGAVKGRKPAKAGARRG